MKRKPAIPRVRRKSTRERGQNFGTSSKKKSSQKRWDAIIKHVGIRQCLVGAEIGVDTGKTAHVLFEKLPGLFLYLVDRWIETPEGDSYFKGAKKLCHEKQEYFDKAYEKVKKIASRFDHKILKMDSVKAAESVKNKSLDFVFIDGDHSYEGTSRDIESWLPKVKIGGFICGHDYDNQNTIGDVKTAVDERFKNEIILDWNTTWFHKVTEEDHKKKGGKKKKENPGEIITDAIKTQSEDLKETPEELIKDIPEEVTEEVSE